MLERGRARVFVVAAGDGGNGGLGYGRESGEEMINHDDIILLLLDLSMTVLLADLTTAAVLQLRVTVTWRGGLDLFYVRSSYAMATVSHRSGAHTKIVLFPTLVKNTPPRSGGGLRPYLFFVCGAKPPVRGGSQVVTLRAYYPLWYAHMQNNTIFNSAQDLAAK